jgi:hypothetical protein
MSAHNYNGLQSNGLDIGTIGIWKCTPEIVKHTKIPYELFLKQKVIRYNNNA